MRRVLTIVVTAVLLLGAPASAFAAAVPTATPPARVAVPTVKGTPVTPSAIDVQLWPEDVKGSTTLVVVATVPTSAPLPAAVTIPLPEGAMITWAGEIFDTNQNDIPRQPEVAKDRRSITITTQRSRVVQYEAQYKPYTERSGRRYAQLDWVQSSAAPRTDFAFRLPPLTSDVKSTPKYEGEPAVNQSGEKLFTLPTQKLAVGKSFKLAIDYAPQLSNLGEPTGKGPDILLISLVTLLVVVVAALAVVVVRSRRTE